MEMILYYIIYLEYLNSVNSFPMLHICIDMFEIVLNDLSKRREYFKKKNEELSGDVNKNTYDNYEGEKWNGRISLLSSSFASLKGKYMISLNML